VVKLSDLSLEYQRFIEQATRLEHPMGTPADLTPQECYSFGLGLLKESEIGNVRSGNIVRKLHRLKERYPNDLAAYLETDFGDLAS
jgi:hypothetical protein